LTYTYIESLIYQQEIFN